jgi:transcriptional regulator GlxA family with amidase domain
VAVVLEGKVSPFELGVACEVFGTDRTADGMPGWDFAVCAPGGRELDSWSGFGLSGLAPLEVAACADLLIVPTCAERTVAERADRTSAPSPEVLECLRTASDRGALVAGFCAGVFALGYAGLLDGRRCTVHWAYERQFRALFPSAVVDPSALYVEDAGVLTSAGTVAAIDLCLHLVRRTRGVRAATALARRMVASPHREGGQAQFVETPVPETADDIIAEVLEWIEQRLDRPITVGELARQAELGDRTFLRRFSAATGTTPHRWVTTRRLDRAQRLLEDTSLSVDEIAVECGYGSAASLRHQFARIRGVGPAAYRRTFTGRSAR